MIFVRYMKESLHFLCYKLSLHSISYTLIFLIELTEGSLMLFPINTRTITNYLQFLKEETLLSRIYNEGRFIYFFITVQITL